MNPAGTQPLALPFANIASSVTPHQVLALVFALVFIVWLIYTVIVTYHWVRYGHRSHIGVPALIVHLVVSASLFLIAASGFA